MDKAQVMQAFEQLLNCPELNQGSLEDETIYAISTVRKALGLEPGPSYDALLQHHEDEAILGCGCVLKRMLDYSEFSVSLTYCPMHKATEDLLDTAKATFDYLLNNVGKKSEVAIKCRNVISKAKGRQSP